MQKRCSSVSLTTRFDDSSQINHSDQLSIIDLYLIMSVVSPANVTAADSPGDTGVVLQDTGGPRVLSSGAVLGCCPPVPSSRTPAVLGCCPPVLSSGAVLLDNGCPRMLSSGAVLQDTGGPRVLSSGAVLLDNGCPRVLSSGAVLLDNGCPRVLSSGAVLQHTGTQRRSSGSITFDRDSAPQSQDVGAASADAAGA